MYTHYNQANVDAIREAAREHDLSGPAYENIRDAQRALSYYREHALTEDQALFWAAVEVQNVMGDGRYI